MADLEEEFADLLGACISDVIEDDNNIFCKEQRFENCETSETTKVFEKKCDIVFGIDLASTSECFLQDFQKNCLNFFDDLTWLLTKRTKRFAQVRVKIIGYGDLYLESNQIKVSPFFVLPKENEKFVRFSDNLKVQTSKSDFSNGLEALALAMKSSWVEDDEYTKTRQVIVLITAKSAYPLEKGQEKELPNYPENMLSSLEDLMNVWQGPWPLGEWHSVERYIMNKRGKRLILYSPIDLYPWEEFLWLENVKLTSLDLNNGCKELDMRLLIDDIAGSLR